MKLASLLFATMAAYTQANDSYRGLATLAQKWNISKPTFSYESLGFTLTFGTFGVSDYIRGDLEMVNKYAVYDENCDTADAVKLWDSMDGVFEGTNGGHNVTDNIASLTTDSGNPPMAGDNMDQAVAITIGLDSSSISQNSNI
jgi:hypothetical protein